jgi:HK97 family phage major capsid protein
MATKKGLELREERAKLVTEARAIFDKAGTEKREMTPAEQQSFDEKMDKSDQLLKQAEEFERAELRSTRLSQAEAVLAASSGRRTAATDPALTDPASATRGNGARIVKFEKRAPYSFTRELELTDRHIGPESSRAFRAWLAEGPGASELRNLQVDFDTSGGFLVPPQEFIARLIQAVDDLVYIRQLATVMTLTGATSLGVPTRDADIADSDWTSELATGSEDTALAFGKRELSPHPLAKRIRISNKLLRSSALNVEQLVINRLAYKFAITQEKAYMTGDGVQKPLGIFVANASGIDTSRDVQTGSATAFTADGIISAKYALKPQYWGAARWIFHRTALRNIRQLKDSQNQYLWNPGGFGGLGLVVGQADTLMGNPVILTEYAPNTFTTGLYVGAFGDFSQYWIVDALTLQVQRLVELYAVTNQTGFIARAEMDGQPVLAEAFVRLITN